jgi:hypothetical protein
MLLDEIVDLRADPPDDLAGALGEPELRARMLEPRVLAGGEEAVDLVLERRDPMRIVLVDLPREVDEDLSVLLGRDRADRDGRGARGERLAGRPAKRQLSLERPSPATIFCKTSFSAIDDDPGSDPRAQAHRRG